MADLGLDRHAFERILYLVPIVLAGFVFSWRGAFVTSLIALACLLPRAIFISPHPLDALLETGAVFTVGNAVSISFASLRREREYRVRLEVAQQEQRLFEEKYRELFESANDAIWIHNLAGNIVVANKACAALTGYSLKELSTIKSQNLFTKSCLDDINHARDLPLKNKVPGHLSEVKMIRKGKSEAHVQLSTNPVFSNGQVVGFQHIARDITEQKRMQENLRFYLHQITRAQEEERKRIARAIHDESVQSLASLTHKIEALAAKKRRLPEDVVKYLGGLCAETKGIMNGLRRFSHGLRPGVLDQVGLVSALELLAEELSSEQNISTGLEISGPERRLEPEAELALFRIAQEALSNVRRHSEAKKAAVKLLFTNRKVKLTIFDNGRGFRLPEVLGDLATEGKLGLLGMQERTRLFNGKFSVRSVVGQGTKVAVEMSDEV
ncbi:MAG: PAS domain S-box protein [Dehalococcoidia bacterium]|nr:MAG: PAS domain S-box protein [Dehalococcoidia bacterium]